MKVYTQVVGLETGDSCPSVLIVTDAGRYLVNVGEGLQRFCMEHKMKLVGVEGIFFTTVSVDTCGGLPGMLLTLADMGRTEMQLFGGPGLSDYLYGLRNFMRRDDAVVHAFEVPRALGTAGSLPSAAAAGLRPMALNDLTATPVVLVARQHTAAAAAAGAATAAAASALAASATGAAAASIAGVEATLMRVLASTGERASVERMGRLAEEACPVGRAGMAVDVPTRNVPAPFAPLRLSWWPAEGADGAAGSAPMPAALRTDDAKAAGSSGSSTPAATGGAAIAVSYIFQTLPINGKFHPQKAAALGIKPGPVFGRLGKGESVQVVVPREVALKHGFPVPPPAAAPVAAGVVAAVDAAPATAASAASAAAAAPGPAAADAAAAPATAAAGAASGKKGKAASKAAAAAAAEASVVDGVTITVTPAHVKDDDTPGQHFAVVHVPSAAFLPALLEAEQFVPFQHDAAAAGSDSDPAAKQLVVVYHFTPPAVASSPEYVRWMHRFGPETSHVMCHRLPVASAGTAPVAGATAAAATAPALASGAEPAAIDWSRLWTPSDEGSGTLYEPPFMFLAQSAQLCKMHALHPTAFPLPHPLPAAVQQLTQADASASGTVSSGLTPLQLVVERELAAPPPPTPPSSIAAAAPPAAASAAAAPKTDKAARAAAASAAGIAAEAKRLADLAVAVAGNDAKAVAYGLRRTLHASADGDASAAVSVPVLQGAPLLMQHLIPLQLAASGPDITPVPPVLTPHEPISEMMRDAAMRPLLGEQLAATHSAASRSTSAAVADAARMPPSARVTFTGTSSAIPSKYRNVSGIYVQMPPPASSTATASSSNGHRCKSILLDGGEGTYGQLCRRFGYGGTKAASGVSADADDPHSVDDALRALAVIWISHMHADHHLGIMRLIKKRAVALATDAAGAEPPQPLLVVGPTRLYQWLLEATLIDADLCGQWRFCDAEHFLHLPDVATRPLTSSSTASAARSATLAAADGAATESLRPDVSNFSRKKRAYHSTSMGENESAGAATAGSGAADDEAAASDGESAAASGSAAKRPRLHSPPAAADAAPTAIDVVMAAAPVPPASEPARAAATAGAAALDAAPSHEEPAWYPFLDKCMAQAPRTRFIVSLPSTGGDGVAATSDHLADVAFVHAALRSLGVASVKVVRVQHCFKAYAIRLEAVSASGVADAASGADATPWSLVYSGDTRPCEEVVYLGRGHVNAAHSDIISTVTPTTGSGDAGVDARLRAAAADGCTLLIHEATFEHDAEGQANAAMKKHTTVGEACAVAEGAAATHTQLTHFSARYPKLPVLKVPELTAAGDAPTCGHGNGATGAGACSHGCSDAASSSSSDSGRTVFVSYDLMTVSGRDIAGLPALLPALHVLFAEEAAAAGAGDDDVPIMTVGGEV